MLSPGSRSSDGYDVLASLLPSPLNSPNSLPPPCVIHTGSSASKLRGASHRDARDALQREQSATNLHEVCVCRGRGRGCVGPPCFVTRRFGASQSLLGSGAVCRAESPVCQMTGIPQPPNSPNELFSRSNRADPGPSGACCNQQLHPLSHTQESLHAVKDAQLRVRRGWQLTAQWPRPRATPRSCKQPP